MLHSVSKGPRFTLRAFFVAATLLLQTTAAPAAPEIGIAFPPVSNPEQIAFSTKHLKALAMRHIRIEENWKRRGLRPNTRDFAPLKARVNALHTQGFRILLTVAADGPRAACKAQYADGCVIKGTAPFEKFLSPLLAEVGGQIDAIQSGNEWDHQFAGSADEFLALQHRFVKTVRAYDADLTIVLGGITARAPYADAMFRQNLHPDLPAAMVDAVIERFCQQEAAKNRRATTMITKVLQEADYDVADLHLYDAPALWTQALNWTKSKTRKPIWITEFGGPNPEAEPSDPAYHAQRLEAYLDAISQLDIDRAYYFKLTDDPSSYHGSSGLFTRKSAKKPAYDVFQRHLRN